MPRVEFSDHHPFFITTIKNQHNFVSRPFHFESAWLTDHRYKDMINSAWKENYNVNDNLKQVREDIQRWKVYSFDQVVQQKKEFMVRLKGIQRCLQRRYVPRLIKLEKKLQADLNVILKQEELMWYQ